MSARAKKKSTVNPSGHSSAKAVLRMPSGQTLTEKDLPSGIVPVAMGRATLNIVDPTPTQPEGTRRWTALAYSGGVFAQWFSDRCIIDLDTLRLPSGPIPTRLTHQESWEPWDPEKSTRIGFSDSMTRTPRGIEAGGGFLSNPLSDRVVADGSQGYPWQVSIIAFGPWEIVPEGRVVIVNGVEMTGGSCILRNADLRAVDFVELGADVGNQILQLATLAAQQGLTSLHRGAAAQHGANQMTTTVTESAKLEAVDASEITIEWLKENRPDLIEAIIESDESEEESSVEAEAGGYEDKEDKAEMSATLAQLEALPGSTPAFVIESLKAKLSLSNATAKLNQALVQRLAEAERKAELAAAGSGAPAVSTEKARNAKAELSGNDPASDWNNSAELRAHYAKLCGGEDLGRNAFLKAAQSCISHGENYLDMLPETIR